ncbi:hypothetical protein DTO013E5_7557 [Penicillium roqueforti]|uniref:Uncharacterized protein n=1 Tax=Penicillium roqueforti (strain FM164) TaxID=1365484 RepID=W6QN02_PENRF|nr:hypothetical protein DTO012A1_3323 [Penicillium roqueforti]CDM37321.1 unnamed protein product [Penicillium roqueforti FM164]KAI2749164.1 hypothetical protein DTO013F2_5708 [Penicillium roqueforti]KAI2770176.1 hypothetical protein DTO012A8_4945 [Penicillium roqueforti]KAI3070553.1 hypothetical protein CBS147339_7515 [Penicillium roqueforti]
MFHNSQESIEDPSRSLLGYVHYTFVNGSRNRQYRPAPGGRSNEIGWRIHLKRKARTTPKEWTDDPYFVCHLLALAQLKDRNRTVNPSKPITYTSRLLATHIHEKHFIILYEAQITSEVLNALSHWRDATTPIQWPTIKRKRIPYQPYDTFASRLIAEIRESRPSDSLSNISDGVDSVDEHGGERPYEPEDSGSSKMMRTSKEAGL